jgi:hypothetical protein
VRALLIAAALLIEAMGGASLIGGLRLAESYAAPAVAPTPATRPSDPAHWRIADPGQGPVPLPKGDTRARELSGITWGGGTRYYAVSDKRRKVFPLTIEIDPHGGAIRRVVVEPGVSLAGSSDLEGIAADAEQGTIVIADESGPEIREYRPDGTLVRAISVPPVFRNARKNLSLESLAIDAEKRSLWTVNEETLANDGPASSFAAGSVVRLQRFDSGRQPNGQWAYITDPLFGETPVRGRHAESSGVSELVALPGNGLLALERAYGVGGLRIRLYEVDIAGATDTSALPSLAGATYSPVRKTLLWQQMFADINYEGAALGPQLDDGSHSLVLISDDGHKLRQTLYALTVRPNG